MPSYFFDGMGGGVQGSGGGGGVQGSAIFDKDNKRVFRGVHEGRLGVRRGEMGLKWPVPTKASIRTVKSRSAKL